MVNSRKNRKNRKEWNGKKRMGEKKMGSEGMKGEGKGVEAPHSHFWLCHWQTSSRIIQTLTQSTYHLYCPSMALCLAGQWYKKVDDSTRKLRVTKHMIVGKTPDLCSLTELDSIWSTHIKKLETKHRKLVSNCIKSNKSNQSN